MNESTQQILAIAVKSGATDLHLAQDGGMMLRMARSCHANPSDALSEIIQRDWGSIVASVLGTDTIDLRNLAEQGDCREQVPWGDRSLRTSYYVANGVERLAIRLQLREIPDIEDLRIKKEVLREMCNVHPGLTLISGGPCGGKTTTLAAVVQKIADDESVHIRTLENPIEYGYRSGHSFITQQRVGRECPNYYTGVEAALMQDVNVIVFGEIKTHEAMASAIKAANLNMAVFGTIHAHDVVSTISRAVTEFPEADRPEAQRALYRCLKMIHCQRLDFSPVHGVRSENTTKLPPLTIEHQSVTFRSYDATSRKVNEMPWTKDILTTSYRDLGNKLQNSSNVIGLSQSSLFY